ncbi:MAG TPA: hypothetical protein DDW52_28035 [Planctomycetaceae bacterium]|nr:hypothetical protein [Planctomycetaceae bacterium]
MSNFLVYAGDELVLEPEGGWEFKVGADSRIVLDSRQTVFSIGGKMVVTKSDIIQAASKILGRLYTKAPYDKVPGMLGDAQFEIKELSELVFISSSEPAATAATNGNATISVMAPAQDNPPTGGVGPHTEPMLKAKWTIETKQNFVRTDS